MPSKPNRYGIKIWILADCETSYVYNAEIYMGKTGHLPEIGLAQRVVKNLSRPLHQHGRNITMDNFFSSIPLAESLLSKRITVVGTLKSNKPQIPADFQKNPNRPVNSAAFGFNGHLTLCSYVPKKGKAVIILSSLRSSHRISDRSDHKPEIILEYNATKGAVDTADQMIAAYTVAPDRQDDGRIKFSSIAWTSEA